MGSGDWFKNVISLKKVKVGRSRLLKGTSASAKSNGIKWKNLSEEESTNFANGASTGNPTVLTNFANDGASNGNPRVLSMPVEDVAATQIQTAFRAYMARKTHRHLKGMVRLQILTQRYSTTKQASTTLSYLHSWSRIQAQIRARRLCMVTEGRIRQKKLENQLKLEAKLHDLEVEWCNGSETMEEILGRIHQREEAAVKRERAMAYAFSHQWRANSNPNLGPSSYELGKDNWGWSWMERWIAARPWESRALLQSSPKKTPSRQASKAGKNMSKLIFKAPVSVKSISPNGKGTSKARKKLYAAAEKSTPQEGNNEAEEANSKKEQVMP
ncbi:protein IQ-DOMAIN 9 [Cornus florida]|uniref:protein IQ-DOMAIN 9 n=1 Tax=Cornus florida TaxID=4283 RepID=UPI0028971B37|nr:protein IQ-DOMAIN 9 [Cornus florida]XP_059663900.1 protein IQ-DOMAIN 9 [Cornus florida]